MPGTTSPDRKKVFIIYGRNDDAHKAVERFLESLKLAPWSFEQIARDQGMQNHTSDIVRTGMEQAHGIVALFTPDEFASLQTSLQRETDDEIDRNRWQARPNVIFEAGMAYGLAPERTILTMMGRHVKLFSDVAAIPYIDLADNQKSRERLRDRLIGIGCDVDLRTTAWITVNLSFSSVPDYPAIAAGALINSGIGKSNASTMQQTSVPPTIQDFQSVGASQGIYLMEISLYICNKQTSKVVDLTNWDRAAGVGIQQFEWHGGDNQIWILRRISDDLVTIRSKHSEKYLTVPESSTPDDEQVIQSDYTGAWNQQWKCYKFDDGSFAFSSRHSGLYLHVKAGCLDNNAAIVQKHWPQGDSQRWRLQLATL